MINCRCKCSCNNCMDFNYVSNNTLSNTPPPGYINLLNYGGFFAYLSVSYISGGAQYKSNSNVLAVGQQARIILPQNSTNIIATVFAQVFPFIWGDIFVKDYAKSDQICLVSYGITLFAICEEVPCTSPGMMNNFTRSI